MDYFAHPGRSCESFNFPAHYLSKIHTAENNPAISQKTYLRLRPSAYPSGKWDYFKNP
jgi:hypothetical protein